MSEKISRQNVADATLEYSCLFGANKNVYRIAPSLQDGKKPGARRLYWSWWLTEKKPKEYTAFVVTGGILVMIGVFVHQLISKPVVVMMIIKKIFGWE